ncbi:MAG TPA: 6-phospho-3-hexuloisomerase [Leifsonia sp.]|jgi:6-phospho-3-hexuloisomerase|nr:6-phospho-3-hexuloisomerase [Microbacteriaceae bacterium]HEV7811508.1 6-phospho-3-hexuloisomerase [Leifsonia sp.]
MLPAAHLSVTTALDAIYSELTATGDAISATNGEALNLAAHALRGAGRVFTLGAGRSGLALNMTAMRLMHLGLTVHVVGEATAPAIEAGDALLVASGSGTTEGIVRAVQKAGEAGASTIAITADESSVIADLSNVTIVVPAARKLDRDSANSVQYAGSLFEQSVAIIGDALFHALWKSSGQTADELWPRHSNLE